ncbi:hypothetical protein ABID95_005654 [Streptomyces atratus]
MVITDAMWGRIEPLMPADPEVDQCAAGSQCAGDQLGNNERSAHVGAVHAVEVGKIELCDGASSMMPAVFTTTSTPPSICSVVSKSAVISCSAATSPPIAVATPPAAATAATTSWARDWSLP